MHIRVAWVGAACVRSVAYFCVWAVTAAGVLGINVARAGDAEEAIAESEAIEDTAPPSVQNANAQAPEILPPVAAPAKAIDGYGSGIAFTGVDGWRYGGSAYLGGDWQPWTSGAVVPIVRLFGADGVDDFKTRFLSYRSETARASVLTGVHLEGGKLDVKLFVGGDYEMRATLRPVSAKPIQLFGGRAAADVWWEPSEGWMVSGSASATTVETGISARLATGWRLPFAWIGPEIQTNHDIYNTQWRAGAHLSGLRFGIAEWSIAGGYARDSYGRSSPYARLGLTLHP